VDLQVTERILKNDDAKRKIIVSESGINSLADLRFLRACGAHAFLIGSAIMLSGNVEEKVKQLVRG
jgi:indole-3-glycerol phosphate synthase